MRTSAAPSKCLRCHGAEALEAFEAPWVWLWMGTLWGAACILWWTGWATGWRP
jgi:hypothetical protein